MTIGVGVAVDLAGRYEVEVRGLLEAEDYAALGLAKDSGAFKVGEISGELLVLELFNRFCLTCWEQAPLVESFWQNLESEGLRDRVKVLYWEGSGFVLWMKRLERERFHWPRGEGATVTLTGQQLNWLLAGFDIFRFPPHQQLNYGAVT